MDDYRVLVTDYDLTLTAGKHLDPATVAALKQLKASGRKLVLVTGRTLPWTYGPEGILNREEIELFDRVVGENGAVIWNPATDAVRLLGSPPSPELTKRFLDAGVVDMFIGWASVHVKVADAGKIVRALRGYRMTMHPIEGSHHLVFVSHGIDKASGMRAALAELGIEPRHAVTIGDGGNDVEMLDPAQSGCGLSVAVANAVPRAKAVAMRVSAKGPGEAVREIVAEMIAPDLQHGTMREVA